MRSVSKNRIPAPLLGVRGIGRPVNYYAGASHRGWRWVGLLLILWGIICLLGATTDIVTSWFNFGLAAISENWWLVMLLGGMLCLAGCLVFFIEFFVPEKRFMSYEGGLVCSQGRKIFIWHWEDFTSLLIDSASQWKIGFKQKSTIRLKLGLKQGGYLGIGPAVKGINGLRDEIRARLYPRWQADVEGALYRGETVHFGSLAVSRQQGISCLGWAVAWEDLEKITIQEGLMAIYAKKQPGPALATLPTKDIPNLDIFAGLVKPYLVVMGAGRG